MACSECGVLGAPPNMILNMPPPPLPSFLLPKSANAALPGNNNSQPCFAAFMCEPSLSGHSDNSIEYIELPRNGQIGIEETWFFVLVSSLLAVLLLGTLFAIILIKCRDSYNCSFRDTNLKHQSQLSSYGDHDTIGGAKTLPHGFLMQNGQLTCTIPASTLLPPHHHNYNQPVQVDSRLLWATLTPHGTMQHFVEPYPQEDHYEAVDYNRKAYQACVNDLNKSFSTSKKSINKTTFENNGFIDYDYEDPTPLIANTLGTENDLDSGYQDYQEPQDMNQPNNRSPKIPVTASTASTLQRPRNISTPTRIANPNIPPLNANPSPHTHHHYNPNHHYRSLNKSHKNSSNSSINTNTTGSPINKRSATITRRISDVANN